MKGLKERKREREVAHVAEPAEVAKSQQPDRLSPKRRGRDRPRAQQIAIFSVTISGAFRAPNDQIMIARLGQRTCKWFGPVHVQVLA